MSGEPLLSIRGLVRNVPQGNRLLDGISFDVTSSERIALVGPSGAGKSLLCRAIAFLDPWDEGELRFRGALVCDADVPAYRARVMYVGQRPSLHEGTVEENLKRVFRLKAHTGKSWDERFVRDALVRFGFGRDFLKRSQRDLSGGEGQVVSLVRALQLAPTVLLLDEPTSAMDPERVGVAEALVKAWQEARPERSYLWITHHEGQVPRVGERLLRIVAGKIEAP